MSTGAFRSLACVLMSLSYLFRWASEALLDAVMNGEKCGLAPENPFCAGPEVRRVLKHPETQVLASLLSFVRLKVSTLTEMRPVQVATIASAVFLEPPQF